MSATLHLICGLPCSGKTTLARRLERDLGALRLTPDEWHTRLFGQDVADPAHDARHDAIEALLGEVAARALSLGVSVILDFGFWSRAEREGWRVRAAEWGAASEIHYLGATPAMLTERLAARNARQPTGAFVIPEAQLAAWMALFEPPAGDELARREAPRDKPN